MRTIYLNTTTTNYPFGMLINERTYTSDSYRFGFNGMEKDDDVSGEGNSLDFGARVYDSRLGRWLSMDPLWKVYPSYSSFNFGACNPINNIDIAGKSIVPVDEKSKKELQTHFTNLFSTKSGADKMTTLLVSHLGSITNEVNGTLTINPGSKISQKEFRKALKGLSPDQKSMARGYFKMINSDKKALIQIGANSDKISPLSNISKDKNGKVMTEKFDNIGELMKVSKGGATIIANSTVENAQFEVAIIMSTETNFSDLKTDILDKDGYSQVWNSDTKKFDTPTTNKSSFDEVLAHEAVGHGYLEGFLKRNGAIESIRVSNIVRRIRGGESPRSGHDHDVNSGTVDSSESMKPKSNMEAVPKDLMKNR